MCIVALIWSVMWDDRDQFVTCGGNGVVSLWQYEYPKKRELDGKGVAGKITQRVYQKLSTQPINSWHFHPEKKGLAACTTLDQKINVVFVTKLWIQFVGGKNGVYLFLAKDGSLASEWDGCIRFRALLSCEVALVFLRHRNANIWPIERSYITSSQWKWFGNYADLKRIR